VGRSRSSAKAAGQRFERLIADHLRDELNNEFIDIRPKNGRNDRGDIGGVRHHGHAIVLELKDYGGVIHAATWIHEAEIERGNDDALAGVVVVKRRGTTKPGEQFVLMTMDDFTALLTLERPE
jgi:hypothetical protein